MARPRHCVFGIGLALAAACLAACSRPANAPNGRTAPAARAQYHAVPRSPRAERILAQWRTRIPAVDAAAVPATLRQAGAALDRNQLERGSSPGPGALELYMAVLETQPTNAAALNGVQSTLDALLERGTLALRAGRIDEAERVELIATSLQPGHPDLAAFRQRLVGAHLAEEWVARANIAGRAGHFTTPVGGSAADFLAKARKAFTDFDPADAALAHWNGVLLDKAWKAALAEDYRQADALLQESGQFAPASTAARIAGLRIVEQRQATSDALLASGNRDVDALRLDEADGVLAHARRVAAQRAGPDSLAERIFLARHYGPFKPRQTFAEPLLRFGVAPEMVVVARGSFMMGSLEDQPGHQDNESPAHWVNFERGFAIARNEITVGDFRRFVDASHYRTWATRQGHSTVYDEKGGTFAEHQGVDWRRDHVGRLAAPTLPVVHIALQDAMAYARWLSSQTQQRYRLPTEAEFEYVLRAGRTSAYPWGSTAPLRIVGNLPGEGDLSRSGRRWGNPIPGYRDAFWGPSPVRNFPMEGFGTFDMIGNVSEWTLDCWHDSYQRSPLDGSAWVNPGCPQRVVRGASWGSSLDQARSASRLPVDADTSTARLGFRVVREL